MSEHILNKFRLRTLAYDYGGIRLGWCGWKGALCALIRAEAESTQINRETKKKRKLYNQIRASTCASDAYNLN